MFVLVLAASCGGADEDVTDGGGNDAGRSYLDATVDGSGEVDARTDTGTHDAAQGVTDGGSPCIKTRVTLESLLHLMTDLGALARRSPVPYRVYEYSSYDRRSVAPMAATPGEDQTGWFANHDWGNYLRTERGPGGRMEYVVLDVTGPGAIVKFWSATPRGVVRFYLDDFVNPALEADMEALLAGTIAPFTPPFGQKTAAGGNLDFPFPFRQRAKVTIEGDGPALFYNAVIAKYEAACADVVTYSRSQVTDKALADVRAALTSPQPPEAVEPVVKVLYALNTSMTLDAAEGGSEITRITVLPGDLSAAALRQTVLSVTFDGIETIRVPAGDFFGAGPGLLAHKTLPLEVLANGNLVSRFVMPFAKTAQIRVTPTAGQKLTVTVESRAAAFDGRSYYFHSQWKARGPMSVRPFRDVSIAEIMGEGLYVGTTLSLHNNEKHWWGEGDEKVWVDDDKFPSWFGTGTEDYFGYAYNTRELFDHPFRSQSLVGFPPDAGFDYRGQVANGRFHFLDAIPFKNSIRFDLELFHWDPAAVVTYDTVSYFYARPGAVFGAHAEAKDFRLPPQSNP